MLDTPPEPPMHKSIPGVPAMMTLMLGLFMVMAGFGSILPGFVKDRVPEQFIPIWQWILRTPTEGEPVPLVMALAYASQWLIGCTEFAIGVLLLAATFLPHKRLSLTSLGVMLATAMFGAFMLTMFAMHDYNLPRWNQFPAILAWLGVIWAVVWIEAHSSTLLNSRQQS
jgi:hypothetical protein